MRIWLFLIALVSASAFAAKPAVVLTGPAPVTKWVGKELSKRYSPKTLAKSVSAMPTAKEVRDVTAPSGAIALVMCQSSGNFVTLQVLNGADGTPLDTVSIKTPGKKLPKAMPKPQLAALMFAVGSGKAPAKEAGAPAPQPVAEKEETDSSDSEETAAPVKETPPPSKKEVAAAKKRKEESPPEARGEEKPAEEVVKKDSEPGKPSAHPAFRAAVGAGGFNRSFGWGGNPSPALATSSQPFSGDISVDATWYPGAHFTSNFLAHLGMFITGDFGVGMVSRVGESRFAHSATRLRVGGLVRLPLGDRFSLAAHAGYARQDLTTALTAVDGSARPNIPDVAFNAFRTGLGFRWRMFGTVELDGLGGFQLVSGKTALGELGSAQFFPEATAVGVDAGGGISVGLAEHLRLRAGVEWQRYFITLNAAETSRFFAQTAFDQYITAAAYLQWTM
jgi:hypothetical protein